MNGDIQMSCDRVRIASFIGQERIDYGKGLHIEIWVSLLHQIAGHGRQSRGIQPAAHEDPYLIGAEPVSNSLTEEISELIDVIIRASVEERLINGQGPVAVQLQ